MHVKRIRLINFRNYHTLDITLNNKLNLFLGNNAQGKTNLLESIYIASAGKSYRTNRDKELINLNEEQAYIGLELEKNNINKMIEIKFEKNKPKRVKVNSVELDKVSDIIGVLNVVIFSPEDLKLVKEGPSQRRDFLNNEISQIKPKYRYNINRYKKILIQRNNLLKIMQNDRKKGKIIEVWNEQLADLGSQIIISRIGFLENMSIISNNIHKKITGDLENLSLRYMSSLNIDNSWNKQEIKQKFLNELEKNLDKDIERGTTTIGPHRDDIKILIDGVDCRVFGSQGQQRTAALSLKLAEVQLIKNEVGEYPVLLLDDVLSELDYNRRSFLLSAFKNIQTIITSTDDIEFKGITKNEKSTFYINKGKVKLKK
ncbi:DNA replication/repair protein RecF [Caldisalinibacter kiritimatiensis]|uniref:DNA replication and repair protein RecF n=1 Tax=Caldisalinibacter kiritimatiensis TaxID=1304284 RepID=R1AS13_9FIRM|nr:DNA replication/repair protein RecF [Caldisalinibacter kiritimatiensis]EOC99436.1 DNA recombination and repair protein RecF [Caldisalinibacter kiritimatiensis]